MDGKIASESYNRWNSGEPNNVISNHYYEVHASSYKQYDDHSGHYRHTWCEKRRCSISNGIKNVLTVSSWPIFCTYRQNVILEAVNEERILFPFLTTHPILIMF